MEDTREALLGVLQKGRQTMQHEEKETREVQNPGKWAGLVKLAGRIEYTAPEKGERLGAILLDGVPIAHGTTKEAAFAAFLDYVASALGGDYTPEVISYDGNTALIWRDPMGWHYTVRSINTLKSEIHFAGDRAEAMRAARAVIAQFLLDAGHEVEVAAQVFEDEVERRTYLRDYRQYNAIHEIMEREQCSVEVARSRFQDILLEAYLKAQE